MKTAPHLPRGTPVLFPARLSHAPLFLEPRLGRPLLQSGTAEKAYCKPTYQPVPVFFPASVQPSKRPHKHQRFRVRGFLLLFTMLCFSLQEQCSAVRTCFSYSKSDFLTRWKGQNGPLKSDGSPPPQQH